MESTPMETQSTNNRRFFSIRNLNPFQRSTVVTRLLGWKQCDEDERWAQKAVKTLLKKLREKNGAIEELERALSNPGAPSKCVTIPRSLDGRLQILHRKGLPHVIYCRVWRWPDLQSHHELKSVPECEFAYSKKSKYVCVNPYHYNRIKAVVLPPVMVPKHYDYVPGVSLLPFQQVREPRTPQTVTYTQNGFTGLNLDAARPSCSSFLQPQSSNVVEMQPPALDQACSNVTEQMNMNDQHPTEAHLLSQPINYEDQPCWASIAYYELNQRVGEVYNCKGTSIIVDGYTNPDKNGDRFCLGQLSNMYRNQSIEASRHHIGRGIHLYYVNGQVYVECLSNAPIFVQSNIFNHTNNFYQSTVCKIEPGGALKVFDNAEFSKLLSQCVNCSYESVAKLVEMCTIRIAFVKGWGALYTRAEITSTPCWIEIHLYGPLKWLDRVLTEMGGPTGSISSVS